MNTGEAVELSSPLAGENSCQELFQAFVGMLISA